MMADTSPVLLSSVDLRSIFSNGTCCRASTSSNKKSSQTKRNMTKPKTQSSHGPRDRAGWKRALTHVKRDYLEGRYRSCYTQCQDLLAAAKVTATAEAVHVIYLHFYAAISLELQVRSLRHSSPSRLDLLNQARDHYRRASILTEAAEEQEQRQPPAPPSLSSDRSSRASSPALSSADELEAAGRSVRPARKKQVRFKDVPEYPQQQQESIIIRPDSPTLGCDDGFGVFGSSQAGEGEEVEEVVPFFLDGTAPKSALRQFPEPASYRTPSPPTSHVDILKDEGEQEEQEEKTDDVIDEDIRRSSRERYTETLAALRHQITTVHLPALATASATTAKPPPSNDEMRSIEIRARIERLKADGWRRRRFDPARYESLRESALASLMG